MTILEKKGLGRELRIRKNIRNWKRLTGGLTRTQVRSNLSNRSGSPASLQFAQQGSVNLQKNKLPIISKTKKP